MKCSIKFTEVKGRARKDAEKKYGGEEDEERGVRGWSVLTRCWVCREGAVPLRCWMQGRSGDGMKWTRGEKGVKRRMVKGGG